MTATSLHPPEVRTAPELPRAKLVVRLTHVTKRFSNGTLAVQDFSFAFPQHGFISLLGPSGCGKSTVLRMIAGLSKPSSGTLEWTTASHDAQGAPSRELAFVFQEPTLMPWATALHNVMLPLKIKRVAKAEARERALAALAQVGLSGFENAYPRELSGGMKMRVSIARAIVERPRVLLMDEPFAALDEFTRFKLNKDLLRLWQENNFTVVFVTHSVFESVFLSQHVLLMAARPGRVMARVPVPAPYPRDEAFRISPLYNECCREVLQQLGEATARD
jgi:NitT/TauT family transport system ATP-binding protein